MTPVSWDVCSHSEMFSTDVGETGRTVRHWFCPTCLGYWGSAKTAFSGVPPMFSAPNLPPSLPTKPSNNSTQNRMKSFSPVRRTPKDRKFR